MNKEQLKRARGDIKFDRDERRGQQVLLETKRNLFWYTHTLSIRFRLTASIEHVLTTKEEVKKKSKQFDVLQCLARYIIVVNNRCRGSALRLHNMA